MDRILTFLYVTKYKDSAELVFSDIDILLKDNSVESAKKYFVSHSVCKLKTDYTTN